MGKENEELERAALPVLVVEGDTEEGESMVPLNTFARDRFFPHQ